MAVADEEAADPPAVAADPAAPSRQARGFVHLKSRAEFLRVAKGARFHTTAFSLQAAPIARPPADQRQATPARFGLTVTKKTAGAVQRNRIRRRLREAVRACALAAKPGCDYVLVARQEALVIPFIQLTRDLVRALEGVHGRRGGRHRGTPGAPAMSMRPSDRDAIDAVPAPGGEPIHATAPGQDQ